MLTTVYALLFYVATTLLLGGLAVRIWSYWRTPAPLKIPTTPAPTTRIGVVLRITREVVLFASLFKSNKWTWLFGWLFHFGMVLALLEHLRYFDEPAWWWVKLIQPFGVYGGFAMLVGLLGLWARRLLVDRVRFISSPSDHLMLALLVAIAGTGLAIRYLWRADIAAVKSFVLGWMAVDWQPLPADPVLLIHLALVAVLLMIFPISKLLHAPGIFFSPTLNQVDNPREKRHTAGWSAKIRPMN